MGLFSQPNINDLINSLNDVSSQDIFGFLVKNQKEPLPIRKMKKLGIKSIPALSATIENAIKSKNVNIIICATYILSQIMNKSSVPTLLRVFEGDFYSLTEVITKHKGKEASVNFDPFDYLYDEIMDTLFLLKDDNIITAIRKVVANKNKVNVRPHGIKFLQKLGDKEDLHLFISCLADKNRDTGSSVRHESLMALKYLSDSGAHDDVVDALINCGVGCINSLVEALSKSDTDLREWAVKTLGEMDDKRIAPAIVMATLDQDPNVAQKAMEKLTILLGEKTAKIILEILEDDYDENRKSSRKLNKNDLQKIEDEHVRHLLIFLKQSRINLAKESFNKIKLLKINLEVLLTQYFYRESRKLNSRQTVESGGKGINITFRNEKQFSNAVEKMIFLGGTDECVDTLVDALNDYSIKNRIKAIDSLVKLGDKRAIYPLCLMALDERGITLERKLTEFIRKEDVAICRMATLSPCISAIRQIGGKEAIEALEYIYNQKCSNRDEHLVREDAENVLLDIAQHHKDANLRCAAIEKLHPYIIQQNIYIIRNIAKQDKDAKVRKIARERV